MTKVLIVEDEEIIQKALKMQLDSDGYETLTAPNGEVCLEVLKRFAPDIVLMDLVMPVMDGFEAIRQIREMENFKNLPIIVLSNLSQEEEIQEAKELGIKDFFIKADNDLSDISKRIKELINPQ
jgi:two-component system alkaline phosphatase synthesis response regulator PhoP